MAETVSGHQLGAISTPANGAALVASVVRGNFQSTRTAYNAHDADPGVHLQSSVAGSKPSAGSAGRKWLETDTLKVFYDNGSTWDEIAYLGTAGGTLSGALTVSTGGVTVGAGGVTVTGNSTITGTLGGLTGLTMASGTLAAVDLTVSGTFTPAGLTSAGNLTFSGASRRIIPGTTSLVIRNVGNTTDAIVIESNNMEIGPGANQGGNLIAGTSISPANATDGYVIISTIGEAPTGALADGAIVVDTANHRLYVRSGSAWHYANLL